jgi:hypothetical protein
VGREPVEDPSRDLLLRQDRKQLVEPVSIEQADDVRVRAEAGARGGHVVGDDEIEPLRLELATRLGRHVVRLGGEADEEPAPLPRREAGEDVGGALQLEGE